MKAHTTCYIAESRFHYLSSLRAALSASKRHWPTVSCLTARCQWITWRFFPPLVCWNVPWPLQVCYPSLPCLEFKWAADNIATFCSIWSLLRHTWAGPGVIKSRRYYSRNTWRREIAFQGQGNIKRTWDCACPARNAVVSIGRPPTEHTGGWTLQFWSMAVKLIVWPLAPAAAVCFLVLPHTQQLTAPVLVWLFLLVWLYRLLSAVHVRPGTAGVTSLRSTAVSETSTL
jgi:hypothetical protein